MGRAATLLVPVCAAAARATKKKNEKTLKLFILPKKRGCPRWLNKLRNPAKFAVFARTRQIQDAPARPEVTIQLIRGGARSAW
jgi:hypothetical protein